MVYRSHLSIEVIVAAPVIADGAVAGGCTYGLRMLSPFNNFVQKWVSPLGSPCIRGVFEVETFLRTALATDDFWLVWCPHSVSTLSS